MLDDADLHQRQSPFSLGCNRAIASTLNSLVFHTAFPESAGMQPQQPGQQQHMQQGAGVAQQAAVSVLPVTLRHGMVSCCATAGFKHRLCELGSFSAPVYTPFP